MGIENSRPKNVNKKVWPIPSEAQPDAKTKDGDLIWMVQELSIALFSVNSKIPSMSQLSIWTPLYKIFGRNLNIRQVDYISRL